MKVTNTSARLFYLPGANELVRLAPLQTLEVSADNEAPLRAAFDGPLKHYVKTGDLVVEGGSSAPAPSSSSTPEPSSSSVPTPSSSSAPELASSTATTPEPAPTPAPTTSSTSKRR